MVRKVIARDVRHHYEKSGASGSLPGDFWQDFFKYYLEKQGNSQKVRQFGSKPPSEAIPLVMQRGAIDLGNGCKAVKCPKARNPGICAMMPCPTSASNEMICSGPTEQVDKGGLILPERRKYEKKKGRMRSCPFGIKRFDRYQNGRSNTTGDQELQIDIAELLKKHPDYSVESFK